MDLLMLHFDSQHEQSYPSNFNRELKHVIEIARGQLYRRPQEEEDPVIPTCYYWDETKVAEWIDEVGFPELQVRL